MTESYSFSFHGDAPGPKLIVLGAVHGNETCGTQAIQTILQDLDEGNLKITAGTLTLVPIVNRQAYAQKQRAIDHNLNRGLSRKKDPKDCEDAVANLLCPLLEKHDVLLDLHSFHNPGAPFALIGPENNQGDLEPFTQEQQETNLALHLGPTRFVEGWMRVYETGVKRRAATGQSSPPHLLNSDYAVGTTEYMRSQGGYAVTYECGQHAELDAPVRARYAILQALKLLGLIEGAPDAAVERVELLKLINVVDRLDERDAFAREFKSFDPIRKGEQIATRADGTEIFAETDGFIVFPSPHAPPYTEWYYFAARSDRVLKATG